MGPIQGGINQIIQSALHGSIALKIGSGIKAQKDIKNYITGVTKEELSPEELYKRQQKAPNVSQSQIDKYYKKNPDEAKKMTKGAISVPADKADKIKQELAKLDAETENVMANLPTYSPVPLSEPVSPASSSLAEASAKRLSQITKFESLKNNLKEGKDSENG